MLKLFKTNRKSAAAEQSVASLLVEHMSVERVNSFIVFYQGKSESELERYAHSIGVTGHDAVKTMHTMNDLCLVRAGQS